MNLTEFLRLMAERIEKHEKEGNKEEAMRLITVLCDSLNDIIIRKESMADVKRIRFKGTEYWLIISMFCDGLIAPINHFDDDGNITPEGFNEVSYAIVENGKVMRRGEPIGDATEIEYV